VLAQFEARSSAVVGNGEDQAMKPEVMFVVALFLGLAVLEMALTGFFRKPRQTRSDAIVEVVSAFVSIGVIQPTIIISSALMMASVWPEQHYALAGVGFLVGFAFLMVADDFTVYLWHRLAHSVPTLYKLHRPHHNGEYMSVRVTFRNNLFYYAMSPSMWMGGVMLYLGLGGVFVVYKILKSAVVLSSHSDVRWDEPLYRIGWLSPVMYVVERIIVTPAVHHAHHGKYAGDGITHYKGNFGNFFMIWDVLLGTAHITRQVPVRYGVEDLPPTNAAEQLFWPLVGPPQAASVREGA
jgi:sterol desaturase/sphingolipid hydroxylase (fatty acid hydroxylase superfamily)